MNNSQTSNKKNKKNPAARHGILFLISAPSGAGKSTMIANMREHCDVNYSVSCTTRSPRPGEIDGQSYFFLGKEEFLRRIEAGDFLEYAEVHGNFYGTLKETVRKSLDAGHDIVMDVDVVGAQKIRACSDKFFTDALVDIFVMPPSIEELRRRLLNRGADTAVQIALRIHNAAEEMQHWRKYRYMIVTTSVAADLAALSAIVAAERTRSIRLEPTA